MALEYGLNEQQRMIAGSAEKLLADNFSSSAQRAFLNEKQVATTTRRALGASGLLGICAPTSIGGSALGAEDALAILIAAGSHAVPWPVADSIVAAAMLAESPNAMAEAVINAETIIGFASAEGLEINSVEDGWTISGDIDAVPWAPLAQALILDIDLDGQPSNVVLDVDLDGVILENRKGIDPLCPTARVRLDNVAIAGADLLAPPDTRWIRLRTLFACAEMLGAARTGFDMAVDYMKVRKQFGHEIGRFQALKHIAANDALLLESMRLALEYAAWAHDVGGEDVDMALHIAKQYCSDNARTVAEDAIQCHGGIGFTWDYDLHFYLRRILRLGASLGSASDHREAIAASLVNEFSAS